MNHIKLLTSLLLFLISFSFASDNTIDFKNYEEEVMVLPNDSIVILSKKLIIKGTEEILIDSKSFFNYELDEINGKIKLLKKKKIPTKFIIRYQYISGLTKKVDSIISTFDSIDSENLTNKNDSTHKSQIVKKNNLPLVIDGTFSRKVDLSSNASSSINGGLKLNIQGKILDDMTINAVLSDQNIAIQPQGNTKNLNEFDKLYIEINTPNSFIKVGDIDYKNLNSKYQNHNRRLEGINFSSNFSKFKINGTIGNARGKFNSVNFNGEDQNQGPYPLYGLDGSRKILITPDSESIWINGKKIKRGESNDYLINYNNSEITFTPMQTIDNNTRIYVEYEYHDFGYQRDFLSSSIDSKALNKKFNFKINFISEKDRALESNSLILNNFLPENHESNYLILNDNHLSTIDSIGKYIIISNPDNLNDSIYYYSPNSLNIKYKVTFINYGSEGDYLKKINEKGKVYFEYVNLIDRKNHIELYSPYKKNILPKSHNVTSLVGNYKINKKSELKIEFANSYLNENISINFPTNNGIASNISFISRFDLPLHIGELSILSDLKNSGKNFFSHQNNIDIEFWRERNLNKNDWDLILNKGLGYKSNNIKVLLEKKKKYFSSLTIGNHSDYYQKSKNFDFSSSYNNNFFNYLNFNYSQANRHSFYSNNSNWIRKQIEVKLFNNSLSPIIGYNEEIRTNDRKFYESTISLELKKKLITSNLGFIKRDDFIQKNTSFDLLSSSFLSQLKVNSKLNKYINGSLIFKNHIKNFKNKNNLNYNLSKGFLKYISKNRITNGSFDFLLERNLFEEKITIYEFIGKGLGNHRYDINSEIYLPDQVGDYFAYNVPSGIRTPSTHFISTFRINNKFSNFKNKILKYTSSRFHIKTDFNGGSISYNKIFHPTLNMKELKSSRILAQIDIRYTPQNSYRRAGFKLIKTHNVVSNILQPLRDELHNELKLNFEEPISQKLLFDSKISIFNLNFQSSKIALQRKSIGWSSDIGIDFKYFNLFKYGIDFIFGNESGSFGLDKDNITTTGLKFNSIIFPEKNARIDAKISFYNIIFKEEIFESLPPELARGFQPGINIKSSISSIFNINKDLSLNLNITYLDDIYHQDFFIFSGEIRALL